MGRTKHIAAVAKVHARAEEYFHFFGLDVSPRCLYQYCRELLRKANEMYPDECHYPLDFEVPSVLTPNKYLDYSAKDEDRLADFSISYGRSKWGVAPNLLINFNSSSRGEHITLSIRDEEIKDMAKEIDDFLSSRTDVEKICGFILEEEASEFSTAMDIHLCYKEVYAKAKGLSEHDTPTIGQVLHYLAWADRSHMTDYYSVCEEICAMVQRNGLESLCDIPDRIHQVCLLSNEDIAMLRVKYPRK